MTSIYDPMTHGHSIPTTPYPPLPTPYPTISTSGTGIPTLTSLGLMHNPHLDRHLMISKLIEEGYWVKMTGSRVTKNGWTDESDWDYVVFDPDKTLYKKILEEGSWVLGSDAGHGEFDSLRKDDVNLILVDKEEIWKKYIIATNLIKTLNSKTKEERIAVFDSVFGKDNNAKAVEF